MSKITSARLWGGAIGTLMVAAVTLAVRFGAPEPVEYGSAVPVRTAPPEIRGVEMARLTPPPFVPPPITRNHATKVVVDLEAIEKKGRLADGVEYEFWTFGGTVPGPFIRVREGDLVELRLRNHHTSGVPHNIDLHAVTGPGGGAKATLAFPGQEAVFTFTALNPGLYVYHCATPPIGVHVGNGMYGLILVEPKAGLRPVDREYYVLQSEFYTKGRFGEPGLQPFDMQKALDEKPEYVVFNGEVGALMGERALEARVGESVRIFVGNGGPNLVSSFHVIGEVFENVYQEGGTSVSHNVQTTLIPAGGAAIVEFATEVPGDYILVDHSLFRAANKGAMAVLRVEGQDNPRLFAAKPLNPHFDTGH